MRSDQNLITLVTKVPRPQNLITLSATLRQT